MADATTYTHEHPPWWVMPGLAGLAAVIYLVALVMAYLSGDKTLFGVLCGVAAGLMKDAYSFFFGSSMGSAKKDEVLAASNAKKDDALTGNVVTTIVPTPTGA